MKLIDYIKQQLKNHDPKDTIIGIEVGSFNYKLLKKQGNLTINEFEVKENKILLDQCVCILGKTINSISSSIGCKG